MPKLTCSSCQITQDKLVDLRTRWIQGKETYLETLISHPLDQSKTHTIPLCAYCLQYKDFLVVGTPMQVVLWILTILFLTLSGTNWWISWLLTFVALIVVAVLLSYDVSSIFSDTGDQKEVAEDRKTESGNPVTD